MKQPPRRILACLALCAILTSALAVPASAAATFRDVPQGHWAEESIQRCVERGFFQGQTEDFFGLGQQMTRSAFTTVLCRFFGWDTTAAPAQPTYRDVPADAWYAGAVETAYAHGALTGQQEDFRPMDAITREELTVMLVRAMGYGSIAGLAQSLSSPFRDVTTNDGYITMAYDLGLVNGTTEETFSPAATATREQVAVILMRLYDKFSAPAPETVAVVPGPGEDGADLTGLDAAAIPAKKLIGAGGKASLSSELKDEAAAALRDAAHQAGAKALLYVTGGVTALNSPAAEAAAVLAEAVESGGYDGLFLDVPRLDAKSKDGLTLLANAVRAALGDKLLYLAAEAPVWQGGKAYGGYDYDALLAAADQLVLRITPYETRVNGFPTAPIDPLEEVYYVLRQLRGADAGKLSLALSTAPSFWSDGAKRKLEAEALKSLLKAKDTQTYYSDRYACSYLTGAGAEGEELVVWYPDQRSVEARLQLAQALGAGQVCLMDWSGSIRELLSGL